MIFRFVCAKKPPLSILARHYGPTDLPTIWRTNKWMDQRKDKDSYRDVRAHLRSLPFYAIFLSLREKHRQTNGPMDGEIDTNGNISRGAVMFSNYQHHTSYVCMTMIQLYHRRPKLAVKESYC